MSCTVPAGQNTASKAAAPPIERSLTGPGRRDRDPPPARLEPRLRGVHVRVREDEHQLEPGLRHLPPERGDGQPVRELVHDHDQEPPDEEDRARRGRPGSRRRTASRSGPRSGRRRRRARPTQHDRDREQHRQREQHPAARAVDPLEHRAGPRDVPLRASGTPASSRRFGGGGGASSTPTSRPRSPRSASSPASRLGPSGPKRPLAAAISSPSVRSPSSSSTMSASSAFIRTKRPSGPLSTKRRSPSSASSRLSREPGRSRGMRRGPPSSSPGDGAEDAPSSPLAAALR